MKEQNFKNHGQIVFAYHIVTGLALIALLIGSIINAVNSSEENFYSATLLVLVSVLLYYCFFSRSFALKAQDRAIRAEESLRYFILTGKPLDSRLTVQQIIALRFAPDAELPALAAKAVAENLSNKAIKQAIKNWRPDYYRV